MDDTTGRMNAPDRSSGQEFPKNAALSAAPTDTSHRTDEIRDEIEQTREDMAETINAIQDKLRPSALVADATGRMKAAATEKVRAMADTAGNAAEDMMNRTRDTAGGLLDTIRDNPMPAAMIGAGVVWVMMTRKRASRRPMSAGNQGLWPHSTPQLDQASPGGRYVEPREHGIQGRAREYANDTSAAIRRTGRQVQHQFGRTLMDNPLLIGAGALLLGAAFGMAMPVTESENEWMGDARDSVVDRAQQLAGDAATTLQEKARDVAAAAGEAVESLAPKT